MESTVVDLRSDTVTRPTPEMYEAIRATPLGDDVLGDDPTVIELERLAADRVGMESAMYVPSGSMGNQIALATHTRPGDAAIFEEEAHMLFYEGGAPGVIAQVVMRTVPSDGVMDPLEVEKRVLARSLHTPGTVVLCVENTHNRKGGAVTPPSVMADYRRIADRHAMRVHLDGARVFNAAVALGVDVREITQHVDSVSFCLSKGLGSPVGSVLCGNTEFIQAARFWRKRLGGGMRQAGILAACGIVSLQKMVDRLAEDHRRAQELASRLRSIPGLKVPNVVETNILMVDTVAPATEWVAAIRERNVWGMAFSPTRIRLVFHYDVDDAGVDSAASAFAEASVSVQAVNVR